MRGYGSRLPQAFGLRNDGVGVSAFAMTVLFLSLRAKRSNPQTTKPPQKNRKEKEITNYRFILFLFYYKIKTLTINKNKT